MSGHDATMVPGGTTYLRELERLSKTVPGNGIRPVTVDPIINARLVEGYKHMESEDEFVDGLAMLGLVKPLGSYRVHVEHLSEDGPTGTGILAWSFPEEYEDEEPKD